MAQAPVPQSDPLADLRDIHMPLPVDSWPLAYGWWILAALLIGCLAYAIFRIWSRWRRNRYRREALVELEAIHHQFVETKDTLAYLQSFQELLKRVALTYYSREQVASLTGESWVDFLDRTCDSHEFSMGNGQTLIDANYQSDPSADIVQLHELGRSWIKHHHDLPDGGQAA